MDSPSDDSPHEIGLTGARFGGSPRRRRRWTGREREPVEAPPVEEPEDGTGSGPTGASHVGVTGARFSGAPLVEDAAVDARDADPPAATGRYDSGPGYASPFPEAPAMPDAAVSHNVVRPYVLTRGRTRPRIDLAIETLVSAVPGSVPPHESIEHARIRELTVSPRSVAEVAALMTVPLGVARVLLADLAEAGGIRIHATAATGAEPDLALMQRVLSGLRRL